MPDEHSGSEEWPATRPVPPLFHQGDLEGLAIEAREQAEYERDRLVELAARAEMHRVDAPFYEDDRFVAWLGREMRTRRSVGGRRERMEDGAMARRIWERIAVSSISLAGPSPVVHPPLVDSPMATAIEEAARHGCAPQWDLAVAAGAGRALWEEPCECWVTLPSESPPGRYVALRVAGDSMAPSLHSGDVILVRLGGEFVRRSIVVARGTDDGYIVKRVSRVEQDRVELESLNPDHPAIQLPRDPSRVLGTVIMRWCHHETYVAEELERRR